METMNKCDPINYMSIEVLERLGINAPSQPEIDVVENVISYVLVHPEILTRCSANADNTDESYFG